MSILSGCSSRLWAGPFRRSAIRTVDLWTWLIIVAHTQLRLARPLAEDLRRPWERPAEPRRLTSAGSAGGSATQGETDYARDLAGHLTSDMLLLADRAFDSNELLADIAAQGAQFLVRATSVRRPPVPALLPDGSYLTRIGSLPLRVIETDIRTRTAADGVFDSTYRLLTTLGDYRTDPADHLVRLYHERWGATRSRTSMSELPEGGRQLLSTG